MEDNIKCEIEKETERFKSYLNSFIKLWTKEKNIIVEKLDLVPIEKMSDKRMQDAISHFENKVSDYSKRLIRRIKVFDKFCTYHILDEYEKADVLTISRLVNTSVEILHLEHIFFTPTERKNVGYEIPSEILDIRSKWNSIVPQLLILTLTIKNIKEQISAKSDKLLKTNRKLTRLNKLHDTLGSEIMQIPDLIREKEILHKKTAGKIQVSEKDLKDVKETLESVTEKNSAAINECQATINVKCNLKKRMYVDLSKAKYRYEMQKSEKENDINELKREIPTLEREMNYYRNRAAKSIFFKKKNAKIADGFSEKLENINLQINDLEEAVLKDEIEMQQNALSCNQKIDSIQLQIQEQESCINQLSAEINYAEQDVERSAANLYLQVFLQCITMKLCEKLQDDLEHKKEELEKTLNKIETEKENIQLLTGEIEELEANIDRSCMLFLQQNEVETVQEATVLPQKSSSLLEKWLNSCFSEYIDRMNEQKKIYTHLEKLKRESKALKYICSGKIIKQMQKQILEYTEKYEQGYTDTADFVPYFDIDEEDILKGKNKYSSVTKIKRKFCTLMKYIHDGSEIPKHILPFDTFNDCISLNDNVFLWFCPYYAVFIEIQNNDLSVRALSYNDIRFSVEPRVVSLDFGEIVPKDAKVTSSHWEYERANGSKDLRYKNNRERFDIEIGILSITVLNLTKKVRYITTEASQKTKNIFDDYQSFLAEDKNYRIIKRIFLCDSVPDIKNICDEIQNEIDAENEAKKEKIKRLKEEEKAARKRAEEERRIQAERQRQLEQRYINAQRQKENDEKLIREHEIKLKENLQLNAVNNDLFANLDNLKGSPIEASDRKRVITSGIAKIKLVQSCPIENCKKYMLYFMDSQGQKISDSRLLEQKTVGEITTIPFELKSKDGFDSDREYFLIVTNFESGQILGKLPYKINIAFANDFDF